MDVKQLEYFMAIAEARSFSRAADNVRIAQSALSRQVRLLEEELGIALFDRHGRGVELTDAGALLHSRARAILGQIEETRHDIIARAVEPAGEVCLAIPPSMRTMIGARVIQRYRHEYPNVFLRIAEGTTNQSRERVARGDADVGLISTAEPAGDLNCTPLVTDALMLVGPADAEICRKRSVPVEQLAELPLIVTPHPNSLRNIVDAALRERGLRAQPVMEGWTVGLLTDLIALGLGYTVLPYAAIRNRAANGTIAAVEIDDLSISWQIATGRGRPLSEATRRLVAMIEEETAKLAGTDQWPMAELTR